MPLVYADTSALFAFFHPKDQFSAALMNAVNGVSPIFWGGGLGQGGGGPVFFWGGFFGGAGSAAARLGGSRTCGAIRSLNQRTSSALNGRLSSPPAAPIFCTFRPPSGCIFYPAWTSFGRATRSSRGPPKGQGCASACLPFEFPQPALRRKSPAAPKHLGLPGLRQPLHAQFENGRAPVMARCANHGFAPADASSVECGVVTACRFRAPILG